MKMGALLNFLFAFISVIQCDSYYPSESDGWDKSAKSNQTPGEMLLAQIHWNSVNDLITLVKPIGWLKLELARVGSILL